MYTLAIIVSVIVPKSCLITSYRIFNHGELPCIDMRNVDTRVVPVPTVE